jgi:hypothetical protein
VSYKQEGQRKKGEGEDLRRREMDRESKIERGLIERERESHGRRRETWPYQKERALLKFFLSKQWKRINCKQIARWQHLSRLKAIAFLFEFFLLVVKKCNNLYLRFIMPSSG